MEIRTTKSIQFSGARNTRWVAVDDIVQKLKSAKDLDMENSYSNILAILESLTHLPEKEKNANI